jgi:hypothetical protein
MPASLSLPVNTIGRVSNTIGSVSKTNGGLSATTIDGPATAGVDRAKAFGELQSVVFVVS